MTFGYLPGYLPVQGAEWWGSGRDHGTKQGNAEVAEVTPVNMALKMAVRVAEKLCGPLPRRRSQRVMGSGQFLPPPFLCVIKPTA